ncbi:ribonuclease J [Furfurilactobacillus siliginis]|uniref:Ribonuclease J n=1 Tax=Furfurilactobacillus siliginis TaxID=348151 RepID=A0A0R2L847_9LACO|nr:ribonuclease J [Furfurilactobacillus siliginis]KRN94855.1 beta-lactamase domain-containing protein [Furfurilactobacillus siliginis]GEK28426.1 ribonuclease J [Furfurilactobacillus siliginis]
MSNQVRIIPFGGVRENGKNMYALEVNEDIFILDCGLKYPENELLGIDVVIPDWAYLREHASQIVGVFLTHGHADAIGALPYFVSEFDVPVFGSELTIELAKLNVESDPQAKKFTDFHVVDANTEIDFGDETVSFFKTTHSIPESLGVSVKTPLGNVVYTGDFKFDQTAAASYQTDLARLGEIGKSGVLALLSDSAGAEQYGTPATENQIGNFIADQFAAHEGRIVVASVASNILRLQQIFNAAAATERKVVLMGQDLEKIVRTAMRLNKLEVPDEDLLVSPKDMKQLSPEQTVILATGRMGEPIKVLQRMATGEDKLVKITEGDLVLITTTPSHAMETTVAKTRNLIFRTGAHVEAIADSLRSSGHGAPADLQLMINFMHPDYLIPIQGEYRVMNRHAKLAEETGMAADHIFLTQRGDSLIYDGSTPMHLADSIEVGNTMIDGIGVGDIGNIVLRDRKILSEDGIFIAVVTIDRKKKRIIAQPKITSRGFVYVKASRDLMHEASELVTKAVQNNLDNKEFDWGHLKQDVREQLGRYLFDQTKRHPVILPVIMEVNQHAHHARAKKTTKGDAPTTEQE